MRAMKVQGSEATCLDRLVIALGRRIRAALVQGFLWTTERLKK